VGRGQAHALEGIVASVLLLTSVLFALQMTAVTPLSASTSSQHIENQQQASAQGLLAAADDSGALERAILFWNDTRGEFHGTTGAQYYTTNVPSNEFGEALERAFGSRGLAYNVRVVYVRGGNERVQRMVNQGVQSDHAVTATRTVTLVDDDRLYDDDGNPTDTSLAETTDFYIATDESPDTPVYNVVRVEVVVWRI